MDVDNSSYSEPLSHSNVSSLVKSGLGQDRVVVEPSAADRETRPSLPSSMDSHSEISSNATTRVASTVYNWSHPYNDHSANLPWSTYEINNNGQHGATYVGQGCPAGCYSLLPRAPPYTPDTPVSSEAVLEHKFPPIPALANQPNPTQPWNGPQFKFHWTNAQNYHSAYSILVPCQLPLKEELFSCLRLSMTGSFITQNQKGKFHLRTGIRQRWFTLETLLRTVMLRLIRISNLNDRRFYWWTAPSFLYRGLYDSEKDAAAAIMRGRDAFLPLIAAVTYAVLAVRQRTEAEEAWSWRTSYSDGWDKDPSRWPHPSDWIDRVMNSPAICDLSVPRIGGLIRWDQAEYMAHMVPQLAKANAPILIFWGAADEAQLLFGRIRESRSYLDQASHLNKTSSSLPHLVPLNPFPINDLIPTLLHLARKTVKSGTIYKQPVPGSTYVRRRSRGEVFIYPKPAEGEDEGMDTREPSLEEEQIDEAFLPLQDLPPSMSSSITVSEQYDAYSPAPPPSAPRTLDAPPLWREHIQRRIEGNAALRSTASARELQVWDSRKASAHSGGRDHLHHAHTCYLWEQDGDLSWRRVALSKAEGQDYFHDFTSSQRHYDEVRNVWDLCYEMAPDEAPAEDDDDPLPDMGAVPPTSLSMPLTVDDAASETLMSAGVEKARRFEAQVPPIVPSSLSLVLSHLTPADEAASMSYGVLFKPVDLVKPERCTPGSWIGVFPEDRKMVMRATGNLFTSETQQIIMLYRRSVLVTFFQDLTTGRLPYNIDLSPPFQGSSEDLEEGEFEDDDGEERWPDHTLSKSPNLLLPRLPGFQFQRLDTGYYLICPNVSGPWRMGGSQFDGLVLHHASSLVWLLRQQTSSSASTLAALAELLLSEGHTFNAVLSRPATFKGSLNQANRTGVLGRRFAGYKGTSEDYTSYLAARSRLLVTRGRAALLEGGLAWRLALEHYVNFDTALDIILAGPTALECCLGKLEGTSWWDDGLSPLEKNLLCGVYEVGNYAGRGTASNGFHSWWPKLDPHWRTSGINIHHWTWDDEDWYCRIRDNAQAQPQGNCKNLKKDWNLRFSGNNKKLVANYESMCISWLLPHLS